ncbi:hypothetical protein CPB84DRAFT_1764262 [Gymnopilus junonius]|uniref:Uncharacterized protein n=1 Tax=Gymnopilus junonius TaxID=109634 RepID=A0A9P5NYB3_GYMJU|nr:hypothetical protein CPB84DRAFT_1764262 [Gymnopilus junonius]
MLLKKHNITEGIFFVCNGSVPDETRLGGPPKGFRIAADNKILPHVSKIQGIVRNAFQRQL